MRQHWIRRAARLAGCLRPHRPSQQAGACLRVGTRPANAPQHPEPGRCGIAPGCVRRSGTPTAMAATRPCTPPRSYWKQGYDRQETDAHPPGLLPSPGRACTPSDLEDAGHTEPATITAITVASNCQMSLPKISRRSAAPDAPSGLPRSALRCGHAGGRAQPQADPRPAPSSLLACGLLRGTNAHTHDRRVLALQNVCRPARSHPCAWSTPISRWKRGAQS